MIHVQLAKIKEILLHYAYSVTVDNIVRMFEGNWMMFGFSWKASKTW